MMAIKIKLRTAQTPRIEVKMREVKSFHIYTTQGMHTANCRLETYVDAKQMITSSRLTTQLLEPI
jgi:hypothetical protein